MVDKTLPKFAARIGTIEASVHRQRLALPPLRLAPGGYTAVDPGDDVAAWAELPVGETWGGYDRTVWLHGEVAIPATWAGGRVELLIRLGDYALIAGNLLIAGPEALAYRDGTPYAGVDRWHDALLLTETARGGERYALALEVYSGRIDSPHILRQYELATRDPAADALANDLRAAYDTLALLDPASNDAATLTRAIDAALVLIDLRRPDSDDFYTSLVPARAAFAEALAGYQHGSRARLIATGHAHIDLAWHWQTVQTRRKGARTFATVLRLMEEFPEYRFTQSQPQLYQWLKEDEPLLYEQIKARIAEGRWEPTGAMWVEADTNVPSGESLVRQLIYGMRFFEEEFGRRTSVLWLPDVFGYSWALPQLLRGVGIDSFMTSKISWNDTNQFPHDTFRWRGTDGSEVLTHFITTPDPGERYYTYNGHMSAREVAGTPAIYRQKAINDEVLYLFGWGDGGGGPTREMLLAGRRFDALPGMPAIEQGGAEPFFARLRERVYDPANLAHLPIWEDELYFEFHRGTYTSQGAYQVGAPPRRDPAARGRAMDESGPCDRRPTPRHGVGRGLETPPPPGVPRHPPRLLDRRGLPGHGARSRDRHARGRCHARRRARPDRRRAGRIKRRPLLLQRDAVGATRSGTPAARPDCDRTRHRERRAGDPGAGRWCGDADRAATRGRPAARVGARGGG